MIREPWFWRDDSLAARAIETALAPVAFCYEHAAKLRTRFAAAWRAPTPIICIGNITVGGVGKTPFAIMLARILNDAGYTAHFLSRGHGGRMTGPIQVDPQKHSAADVGDEPLLLAQEAPTWISRNKHAGAAAAAINADLVIMDDGFQNPTVKKDFSVLLARPDHICAGIKIFPAGPLRERFRDARNRADAIVEISRERLHAPSRQEFHHAAWLEPEALEISGPVFAFCGIGDPVRFFDMLKTTGFDVKGEAAFPDHFPYSVKDINALATHAEQLGATLVTTEKDWVRIDRKQREKINFLPVRMRVSDEQQLLSAIVSIIENAAERRRDR